MRAAGLAFEGGDAAIEGDDWLMARAERLGLEPAASEKKKSEPSASASATAAAAAPAMGTGAEEELEEEELEEKEWPPESAGTMAGVGGMTGCPPPSHGIFMRCFAEHRSSGSTTRHFITNSDSSGSKVLMSG